MKRSFVISLRGVFRKVVMFATTAVLGIGLFYFDVPDTLFRMMAESVTRESNLAFLTGVFSFSPDNNYFLTMPYTKTVLAAPPKNEEKIEETAPEDLAEMPQDTDLSNSKSAISVLGNNVMVTNVAGKNFNVEELLKRPLHFNNKTGGYKVLVLHSHTTEAYFGVERSKDESLNIVCVGNEFERILNENGIKTLHITKIHDSPFSLSYKNSLESVTAALAENPTIEVVIDVHRDSISDKNNNKLKPVATVNDESVAQVMIVTGTNAGGLPHNNWSDNLAFSAKLQSKMNELYKGLARPINLSKERYNTHTTKSSIIFEIGADGNTLEEAVGGAKYAATALAALLLGK